MSFLEMKPGDFLAALHLRQRRESKIGNRGDRSNATAQPADWKLAWGAVEKLSGAIWQNGSVAVFLTSAHDSQTASEIPLAVSPSGRFVVVGDLWLAQRAALLRQLEISDRQNDLQSDLQNDLQLVSQLWEQRDRHGLDPWQSLVGMFAIAVWDCDRQVLSVGRDRAGGYTLYYTTGGTTGGTAEGDVRWIAPRQRSLLPHHAQTLDQIALRDYLCCAFVPGERTLWQEVRQVRPGYVLSQPQAVLSPYWTLQEQILGADQPIGWHSVRLRSLLEQTVQDALPAAEPVGCFLSGGIDSSCVTALAARFHTAPVHTFSIHFGAAYPNELAFSSQVAQHCQTQHHVLEISLRDLWDYLPDAMISLDNPIGDPLTVPNLLLGRLAKQFVEVVLNGEGGDPCFGGPKNQPMLIHSLYSDSDHQTAVHAYLASFHKCAADLPNLLNPDIWRTVQPEPSIFEATLQSEMSYLNRLMAINIQFKGADHILTKVNALMRAAGIQGRSPLFDQRIVELSLQIPPEYKLSGVQEKAVLKAAVADLLPDAIVDRPKSGMMVPIQSGFQQHWQRAARALLLNRKAAIAPYLNQTLIRNWLDYRGDTWRRYGVKLWLLSSLEVWLQMQRSR